MKIYNKNFNSNYLFFHHINLNYSSTYYIERKLRVFLKELPV